MNSFVTRHILDLKAAEQLSVILNMHVMGIFMFIQNSVLDFFVLKVSCVRPYLMYSLA